MKVVEAIPPTVFSELAARVRKAGNEAHVGYEDFREEEDSLTGDLGAQIRNATNDMRVTDPRTGVEWTVRTRLRKFRGRGDGALEKTTGADGIIQVEVLDAAGEVAASKGMLFQAKKDRAKITDRELVEQAGAMEDLIPGASAVFEYNEHRYSAVSTQDYLEVARDRKRRNPAYRSNGLGDFLADSFLACNVGLGGLYYDSHRRRLVAPDSAGGKVVSYRLDHRFFITVAPRDGLHSDEVNE